MNAGSPSADRGAFPRPVGLPKGLGVAEEGRGGGGADTERGTCRRFGGGRAGGE